VIDERLCAVLGRARRLQCPDVDPDRAALVGSEELNIVSRKRRRSMPGWWGRRGSGVNVETVELLQPEPAVRILDRRGMLDVVAHPRSVSAKISVPGRSGARSRRRARTY
jgi:hypothetical protein